MRTLTIILLFFSLAGYSQSVKIDGPTGQVSDLSATDTTPDATDLIILEGASGADKTMNYSHFTNMPHGEFHFNDSSITLDMTEDLWSSVTNPTNTLFTTHDADFLTFAGDSVTLEYDGDYISIISLSFGGTSGDEYEITLFVNNVIADHTQERTTSQTDIGNMSLPSYLDDLSAGDDITLKIRNVASDDDATVHSCSWIIWRLHI